MVFPAEPCTCVRMSHSGGSRPCAPWRSYARAVQSGGAAAGGGASVVICDVRLGHGPRYIGRRGR